MRCCCGHYSRSVSSGEVEVEVEAAVSKEATEKDKKVEEAAAAARRF